MLPGVFSPVAGRVADDQRADADQLALAVDQRGAAPGRMRRRSEDRLVEHVFPIAGEFAFGDDVDGRHHVGAAEARDRTATSRTFTSADLPSGMRLELQRLDRPQQPEAELVVIADDVAGTVRPSLVITSAA